MKLLQVTFAMHFCLYQLSLNVGGILDGYIFNSLRNITYKNI